MKHHIIHNVCYFFILSLAICLSSCGQNKRSNVCPACNGTGKIPVQCPKCFGQKKIQCPICYGNGWEECPRCKGDGHAFPCTTCFTSGWLDNEYGEKVRCPNCKGAGYEICPTCGNLGKITCYFCDGYQKIECPTCKGIGNTTAKCMTCNGTGHNQ